MDPPLADAEEKRPVDAESQRWLDRLDPHGPGRERALVALHTLLLNAARWEVGRRCQDFPWLPADEHEDLARRSADDALVAVLEGLDEFRGASRFTTWACKFALLESGRRVRRRAWEGRELPLRSKRWTGIAYGRDSAWYQDARVLAALREAIAVDLAAHERRVLIAVVLDGVPIDVLAERLRTTRGALYETIHHARRKLRARVGELELGV